MTECKKCGRAKPPEEFYKGRRSCKECERARSRAYRDQNREKTRESGRRYAASHREERRAYQREYVKANRELLKAKQEAYRAENRDALLERGRLRYRENAEVLRQKRRDYYEANRELERERARKWHKENPEKSRAISARRRALMAGADVAEFVSRDYVIARDRSRCHICKKLCRRDEIHIDHLVPLTRGGEHSARNLAVACAPCNRRKKNGAANDQLMLVG